MKNLVYLFTVLLIISCKNASEKEGETDTSSEEIGMGTWCEDSQREIPALQKILEAADYKEEQVEMIAMTHDKDTPQGLEEGYEIEYVPSIIFFKDGAEMNRIVEYPQETLEKDMVKILSGKPYKHYYAE